MTHMNAAARAETRQNWSQVLRITEAAAGSPVHPQRPVNLPIAGKLRTGVMRLQAGWRWIERKRSHKIASKRLRVAETISLGEKRTLSIVTVDGAQYLIGSSSGGVQLLTRLDQNSQHEVSS